MTVLSPDSSVRQRLAPLLEPASIALVGASPRTGSVGNLTARCLLESGFAGSLAFINPRHDKILGHACLAHLQDLPEPPDLAILNLGAARLEEGMAQAIARGAKAAVIFDACRGDSTEGRALLERLRDMAREADLPVCGGNAMGFFNIADRCHASFYSAGHLKAGGITLIAHSGSVFTVLALNDPRYRFDLVISPGQEIGANLDEYVDHALTRPGTRVIALFIEGVRRPDAFAAALAKAQNLGVPVVVCKVGKTDESAALALSHTGALAGSAAAFDALLKRFGAIGVDTVDQLMNLSMLLAQGRPLNSGELATVTDSGGLRELLIDRAKGQALPLAELTGATTSSLRRVLPPGLPPSNPLDCAGAIDAGFAAAFENSLKVLGGAPEVGMLGFELDARDDLVYEPGLAEIAAKLPALTDKPCFIYQSFARSHTRAFGDRLADAGVPLLNGLDEMLSAAAALRRLRSFKAARQQPDPIPPTPARERIDAWRQRLTSGAPVGEAVALDLLQDFGIAAVEARSCESRAEVARCAETMTYPLVLKTATEGVAHKSDLGGVVTGISAPDALESAYRSMVDRLGPQVLLQAMVKGGRELAFGYIRDPQFGPLVMLSAGGTLVELLDDRCFALAPFGPAEAARMIGQLKFYPLLQGHRGQAAGDLEALAQALARFSVLAATLSAEISEMDVNPVILQADAVTAVDAFVRPG